MQIDIFERFNRGTSGDQKHQVRASGSRWWRACSAAHGGTVEVESESAWAFVVRLPRYNGSQVDLAADNAAASDGEQDTGDGTAPLIIEDEPDLRTHLSRLFRKDGYAVEAAGDAKIGHHPARQQC